MIVVASLAHQHTRCGPAPHVHPALLVADDAVPVNETRAAQAVWAAGRYRTPAVRAELAVLPPNLTRQLDTLTLAPQIGLLWRSFSCPLPTSTHAQRVNWRATL